MARIKYDWIAIKREYIEGIVDDEGKRVFPAVVDIAQKYGLNYQVFRNRITKQGWTQEREIFATKVEAARKEKRIDVLAGAAAAFDSKCLKVAEALVSHAGAHLAKAGKSGTPLPASILSSLSQTVKIAHQTGRLALGDSTEKIDGPGVQVNNLVAVDFSGLTEDEIDKLVSLGFKLKSLTDPGHDG